MNIQLKECAMIAEIFGGAAVIVTLIFLVLETRENTSAIRAQTYQSLTSELNEVRRSLSTVDMSEIREKLEESGLGALSGPERFRYINNLQAAWGTYESAFYAKERGVLGELEWERFYISICRTYNRDLNHTIWAREGAGNIVNSITTTFRDFIESSCNAE